MHKSNKELNLEFRALRHAHKVKIVFRRGYYDLIVPVTFDWNPANAYLVLRCRVWCEQENRRRFWENK